MAKKYIEAPVPIMVVLNAALKALEADKRFQGVPNGRYEVSWRQPAPDRDGSGARPERYAVSFECMFDPEAKSDG